MSNVPPRRGLIVLLVAAAFALALAWRYSPLAQLVTPQQAVAWARFLADHWWAPVLVIAVYTPASVVMLPRWPITMAAVFAFGPWEAFAYAQTGVVLAALTNFFAGRLIDRDAFTGRTGALVQRIGTLLHQRGLVAVTMLRVVPIAPFVVVNAALGALRIRVHHFVLGTIFGMLPGMLATTMLGDQVLAAIAEPARVNGWLIAAALSLLALIGFAGRYWVSRLRG